VKKFLGSPNQVIPKDDDLKTLETGALPPKQGKRKSEDSNHKLIHKVKK